MAYVGNQLSIIAATIENVFNSGVLIGTDSIGTVLGTNYISDGQQRGLVKGCIVWYFDGTTVYECYVSAVQARPGLGVTLTEIGGGTPSSLTVDDNLGDTVAGVTLLTFNGAVVSGTTPHATATIPSLTVSDESDDSVTHVTHIIFDGATVSGSMGNATVTIAAGAAGIIPESGPVPIKISAFSAAPIPLGATGLVTGILPSGDDDFLNYNFNQYQLLSGQPSTGQTVSGVAGSSDGTNGSYGGNWSITGGYGAGTGSTGGAIDATGGNAVGTGGGINFRGGSGGTTGGYIFGRGGYSYGGTGGAVSFIGGNSNTGTGGAAYLGGGLGGTTGGAASVRSGYGGVTVGAIVIEAPPGPAGGAVSIFSRSFQGGPNGSGAVLKLQSGSGTGIGYASGVVLLQTGDGNGGADVGAFNIYAGSTPGTTGGPAYGGGTGGAINIVAGYGGTAGNPSIGHGSGGAIHVYSGSAVGSGHVSGDIVMKIGAATTSATAGNWLVKNLPTSAAGLPSGAVWLNSNVMTVVP